MSARDFEGHLPGAIFFHPWMDKALRMCLTEQVNLPAVLSHSITAVLS
jgi:hypothetical protein